MFGSLTLAWGTEITSFNLRPDAAAVTFAICDLVSRELPRPGCQKYAGAQSGTRSTPKNLPPTEKCQGMAVDEETKGGNTQVGGTAGVRAGEEKEIRPETMHAQPSYKNARWLIKMPRVARWTQILCRMRRASWIRMRRTPRQTLGQWCVISERFCQCDKSGQDALKTKIKEHEKRQKH